jgi:hypothetical protein
MPRFPQRQFTTKSGLVDAHVRLHPKTPGASIYAKSALFVFAHDLHMKSQLSHLALAVLHTQEQMQASKRTGLADSALGAAAGGSADGKDGDGRQQIIEGEAKFGC